MNATSGGGQTQCPLGFGRKKPKWGVGDLRCPVCTSFVFKAVKTVCGHVFCEECVDRCRDCPLCGADVEVVKEGGGRGVIDGAVEAFVAAHAGRVDFWELEEKGEAAVVGGVQGGGGAAAAGCPVGGSGGGKGGGGGIGGSADQCQPRREDVASFYVQAGLRAMSGGNMSNAHHRFMQSVHVLQGDGDAHGTGEDGNAHGTTRYGEENNNEENNDTRVSLGVVYGCLGDCERKKGDLEKAIQWYERSADYLRQRVVENEGDGVAAVNPLTVTLNKIGETRHMCGDLDGAIDKYKESLQLRRDVLKANSSPGGEPTIEPEIWVNMVLAVAVGEAKVAHACEAAGKTEESNEYYERMVRHLQRVEGMMKKCHMASSHDQFAQLKAYMDGRRQPS